MIHLISYSYPPDNVPAAHRPYQLALALEQAGLPFTLFTRHGVSRTAIPKAAAGGPARSTSQSASTGARWGGKIRQLSATFIELDKALPWALRALPKLWLTVAIATLRDRERQLIWATSPGISNHYLATIVGLLSGSRICLDYRDMYKGLVGGKVPFLSRLALKVADCISAVTPTLASAIHQATSKPDVHLVLNGISRQAIAAGESERGRISPNLQDREILLTYAGALYGGDRPIVEAVSFLSQAAATGLGVAQNSGIRPLRLLLVAGVEDAARLRQYEHANFCIQFKPPVSTQEALTLSAQSTANLVLVGSAPAHRCGIPLKVFDLLGVGRPIVYVGPKNADAAVLLREIPNARWLGLDPSDTSFSAIECAAWLEQCSTFPGFRCTWPLAETESAKMIKLILGCA